MKGKKEGLQQEDHECRTRYLHTISIYRTRDAFIQAVLLMPAFKQGLSFEVL